MSHARHPHNRHNKPWRKQMNREEAKQLLPIIQAFAEGKTIQVDIGHHQPHWKDYGDLPITNLSVSLRIKPEPKLRPWKAEEVPLIAMIRRKSALGEVHIARRKRANGVDGTVMLVMGGGFSPNETRTLDDLCAHWVRIAEDGTEHPCGVMEAE